MKTIKNFFGILAASAALTACVGDLNVTPIDPNANTVDKVLTSQEALDAYISGVYLGFATSGYYVLTGMPPSPAWTAVPPSTSVVSITTRNSPPMRASVDGMTRPSRISTT